MIEAIAWIGAIAVGAILIRAFVVFILEPLGL
jgi:hypothetical protein